jgi:hypothetical protein
MDSFMIDAQSTSAADRSHEGAVALLGSLAACISPPQQATRLASASQTRSPRRARRRQDRDPTAAELYAQLAASTTGTQRIDYLIESARASTRTATRSQRRRLNDARPASRDQQQAITAERAPRARDRKPQGAPDMLATLQQPMTVPVQSDAAAVRGQALFELGRPADRSARSSSAKSDSASILANQRLIWDGLRQHPPTAPVAPTGDRIVDGGSRSRRSRRAIRRTCAARRCVGARRIRYPAAGVLLPITRRTTHDRFRRRSRCCCRSRRRSEPRLPQYATASVAAHLRNGQRRGVDTRLRHVTGRQPSRVLARAARR